MGSYDHIDMARTLAAVDGDAGAMILEDQVQWDTRLRHLAGLCRYGETARSRSMASAGCVASLLWRGKITTSYVSRYASWLKAWTLWFAGSKRLTNACLPVN